MAIDPSLVLLELGLSDSSTEEERAIVQQALVKSWAAVARFLHYDPALKERTEIFPVTDFRRNAAAGIWEIENQQAYLRRELSAASSELQLAAIPVRSEPPIQVWISYDGRFGTKSGAFGTGDLKVEGQDYWAQYDTVDGNDDKLCSDGILRSFGRWPSEPGSIKVVYTAGYSDDELNGQSGNVDATPIMDAVVEEALRRAKKVLTLWKKNAMTGHNAGTITSENLGDYSYSISGGVLDKLLSAGSLSSDAKEKLAPFVLWGLDR
jgi:hypothetical protein